MAPSKEVLDKGVAEFMIKFARFMQGETDECIRCGRRVKAMQKVGRSVFARPCGCRLYQGTVPEAWRKK